MRIVAALAWWDEKPEDLEACVRSLTACDAIVALDGAYRRYPGGTAHSPADQLEAIRYGAGIAGLDCLILQPGRLWAGQVEKRSYLLNAASVGADWIAIVDTDWICKGDRTAVRLWLDRTSADVVSVPFFTPTGKGEAATGWHENLVNKRVQNPHFFRALPGLRVERFHWWYSALKGDRRVWVWSNPTMTDARPIMPAVEIEVPYEIEHRTLARDERHIRENRAFCNDRIMVVERTGQEDDVPGLPPPAYDFETVPYRVDLDEEEEAEEIGA